MIVGVDPGRQGGIAYIGEDGSLLGVDAMPINSVMIGGKERSRVSAAGIRTKIFAQAAIHGKPRALVMETVSAMPRFNNATGKRDIPPGITSVLTMGRNTGLFEMLCTCYEIPFQEIAAATWKKDMSCPGDKDMARALAARYFPGFAHIFGMKTKDGLAEAALIGLWGLRHGLVGRLVA